MDSNKPNVDLTIIPGWLIGIALILFVIVVGERLYFAKVPVNIWGLELNQPSLDRSPVEPIVASGDTGKGITNWQPYQEGILVNVDTSNANFKTTPHYVVSLHGDSLHWLTTGGSEIYDASSNGFKVYVRFSDGRDLKPETAHNGRWHIVWHAVAAD